MPPAPPPTPQRRSATWPGPTRLPPPSRLGCGRHHARGRGRAGQPGAPPGSRLLRPRRPRPLRPDPATGPGREQPAPSRPAAVRVRRGDGDRSRAPIVLITGWPRSPRPSLNCVKPSGTPHRPLPPAPQPNSCPPPHTRHRPHSRAWPSALAPPPSSPDSPSPASRQPSQRHQHNPVRLQADRHGATATTTKATRPRPLTIRALRAQRIRCSAGGAAA